MIKFTIKAFSFLVGIMIVLNYLIFPALTASNTILNLCGLFLIFTIIVLILKYVPEAFSNRFLDEDEMRKVYEIRKAQGKPTILPEGVEPKEKPKRKYNRKPKAV